MQHSLRRSELDVNRGSYENTEAALTAAAHKEIAYLERSVQPLREAVASGPH
ncbi:hypothetical protein FB446DRAFT_293835 [Lentinula raphanica]|nr:hypothetical protein FB446DRAFT_293835 [Lentinula raphanica]